MGHDLHFLERLERISPAQQQIALTLYRDPALVRLVIAGHVDEERERVAIALDHDPHSPHIIVSRDGAFVTCLAAGMQHELAIISRAELDANADWLDHWETPDLDQQRAVDALLDQFFIPGATPSRAQMRQLERFGAFYYSAMINEIVATLGELARMEESLFRSVGALRRSSKHRVLVHDAVRSWWGSHAFVGHLLVGSGICMDQLAPARRASLDATRVYHAAANCTAHPTPMNLLRAAWLCAAVGPAMLPVLLADQADLLAARESAVTFPLLAMVALACRCEETLVEVIAHVQGTLAWLEEPDDALEATDRALLSFCYLLAERTLRHRHASASQLALILHEVHQGVLPEWAADLTDAQHLARYHEEALGALLHTQDQLVARVSHMGLLYLFIPEIARRDGPELYPERPVPPLRPEHEAQRGLELLARRNQHRHRSEVARVDNAAPGRNDPCPCGSGKKFKKCCDGRD